MYSGQLLMADANVFSPWFPREADNALFSWEEIQASGGVGLTVSIWHKNTEEAGQGTEVVGSWSTTGGINYSEFWGLKEMIRFEYTVDASSATLEGHIEADPCEPQGPTETTFDSTLISWIMFRMLAPTWFDSGGPTP